MFLKINEDSYINLNQVELFHIQSVKEADLGDEFNPEKFVITFIMNSLNHSFSEEDFISMNEEDKKDDGDIISVYHTSHFNNLLYLKRLFNTKTEAEEWVKKILGIYLVDENSDMGRVH